MKTNYFQVTLDMVNEAYELLEKSKPNDYHLDSELANISFRMEQASKELYDFVSRISPK